MKRDEDPMHPIIERPWEYEITHVDWKAGGGVDQANIDITFQKGSKVRCLRFLNPVEVQIHLPGSFPVGCGEMAITDVRGRGLENIGVRISEFGASGSPIHLWAPCGCLDRS